LAVSLYHRKVAFVDKMSREMSRQHVEKHGKKHNTNKNNNNNNKQKKTAKKQISPQQLSFQVRALFPPQYASSPDKFLHSLQYMSPESVNLFKKQGRFLVRELFGTQEPELKLSFQHFNIASTSTIYAQVITLKWGLIKDNSLWASVFDECQMLHGKLTFSSFLPGAMGQPSIMAVGAIDYDDSTPLSSFDQGLAYDTSKVFSLNPMTFVNTKWFWHSQGQPDLQWISTQTINTDICYWKTVNDSDTATPGSSTKYGTLYGTANVRFRQVN
jgi:hypothetical protein